MNAAKHLWRRRHLFTRDQLNSSTWPHPRPARDPRLIFLYIAIMASSVVQVIGGVAPSSPQALNDFDAVTVAAFAALAIPGSCLVIYAAFAHSQYWSFVTELIGCLAIAITFGIYLWAVRAIPHYWATNGAWWSLAIVSGHLTRAGIIGRRFW